MRVILDGIPPYIGRLSKPDCPSWASLIAQLVKNPPAMQETLVRSLGQEVSLEKRYATHSRIFQLLWWLREAVKN